MDKTTITRLKRLEDRQSKELQQKGSLLITKLINRALVVLSESERIELVSSLKKFNTWPKDISIFGRLLEDPEAKAIIGEINVIMRLASNLPAPGHKKF
jgi:hypothetical protein